MSSDSYIPAPDQHDNSLSHYTHVLLSLIQAIERSTEGGTSEKREVELVRGRVALIDLSDCDCAKRYALDGITT